MKYNVGDKVKIKEDLSVGKDYNNFYFTKDMREFLGKEVTIACVSYSNYYIKEDNGEFCWTDEMIEGLVDELDNCENKINEEQLTVYDIDFNNLKENDAIICGNKENYDYVVDELYELGYKFYNVDKNYAYGKYENNVVIFIDTHDRLDYADIDYLYNDYGEEYDLKLSDITIIDLRDKNIEDNSIKCSRIITNTQNSKLKNPNKNDILFSINNQINNIINMWSIKDGNYDIETYNKQLDVVERLLYIKERL